MFRNRLYNFLTLVLRQRPSLGGQTEDDKAIDAVFQHPVGERAKFGQLDRLVRSRAEWHMEHRSDAVKSEQRRHRFRGFGAFHRMIF
ncbi:hypothetical protein BH24CHL6_BH24CHL6_03660 [soil metagenome]